MWRCDESTKQVAAWRPACAFKLHVQERGSENHDGHLVLSSHGSCTSSMQPQRPGLLSGGRHRRRPRRKVVVRDLPPTLPAEVFWQSVSPWVQCTVTGETALSRDRPIQPAPGHAPTALYAEYVPGKKRETYVCYALTPAARRRPTFRQWRIYNFAIQLKSLHLPKPSTVMCFAIARVCVICRLTQQVLNLQPWSIMPLSRHCLRVASHSLIP